MYEASHSITHSCLLKTRILHQTVADWLPPPPPPVHTLHPAFLLPHNLSDFNVCKCLLFQSIFSNTPDLHLEFQAVFTQSFQKGAINNSTERCYVIQKVV